MARHLTDPGPTVTKYRMRAWLLVPAAISIELGVAAALFAAPARADEAVPPTAAPAQEKSQQKPATSKPTVDSPAPAGHAEAAPKEPAGPSVGAGERHVAAERPSPETAPKRADEKAPAKGHRIGKPPKQPSPTLPPGAAEAPQDDEARRQIAGGPTVDEVAAPKNDPELQKLRDAERALFPKPLHGLEVGFTWDTPVDDGGPLVDASGLPGVLPSNASRDPEAAKRAEFFRGLTMPDLPTRFDARVVKYLDFYRDDARGRSIARTWAKKCTRLAPALKAMLARAGLPTDLVWLSLIESGHNPLIVSPAGAAGLWQFIPESARMYGLTVDRWVDERLDPERSTEAAVRYLNDLRARFGSWDLAMAAYNMGHGGLLRAVRKYNTNDYWALSRYEAGLPWETSLYVPKILATAIVMDNKKAFGLDDVEPDAPLAYDTVYVGPNVELSEVARAAEVSVEDIRALNAEYLSLRTPPVAASPRGYRVRVPSGRGEIAEKKLAETRSRSAPKLDSYVVRFGDTLEAIAADTHTTARELTQTNHVGADERLEAGTVLFVPAASTQGEARAAADEDVVVVPALRKIDPNRRRVYYRALADDTLADVARAFDVSTAELGAWNALDPSAHLQQGMTLQVFVRPEEDLSRVRFLEEHEVRVLVAGTEEFFEYFEAQNGRKRITVAVKKGDTLATIARRHGMTLAMMERINRVAANAVLRDGDHLVVYAKGDGNGEAPPSTRSDLAQVSAPAPNALPSIPPATAPGPNGSRAVGQ